MEIFSLLLFCREISYLLTICRPCGEEHSFMSVCFQTLAVGKNREG